jgi:HlyD family secretion protein
MTESIIEGPADRTGAAMDRRIVANPWQNRRRIALAVSAAGLLGVAGWFWLPANGTTTLDAKSVISGQVELAPFADDLPVRATVQPAVTAFVAAASGGLVERLLVQDGSVVAQGQALAVLGNADLRLEVLSREAEIAGQLGALSRDQVDLEQERSSRSERLAAVTYDLLKAQRDLGLQRQLFDKGVIREAGLRPFVQEEQYQRQRLSQLRAALAAEAQGSRVQAARLAETRSRLSTNLGAVRGSLDSLVLHAPISGQLTNFTVQLGQVLKAGDPVGQVDSEGNWKLVAEVDEFYLARLSSGQFARDGAGHKMSVSKVLPTVKDGRFQVELAYQSGQPAQLSRGQTIDLRIVLGETRTAVVAPTGAWLDSGSGTSAFVLADGGRAATRRAIRIGRRTAQSVEILDGIRPGEKIILSDTRAIKGDTVALQ